MEENPQGWRERLRHFWLHSELVDTLREFFRAILLLVSPWRWWGAARSTGQWLGLLPPAGEVGDLEPRPRWSWAGVRQRWARRRADLLTRIRVERQLFEVPLWVSALVVILSPTALMLAALASSGGKTDPRTHGVAFPPPPGVVPPEEEAPGAWLKRLRAELRKNPDEPKPRVDLAEEYLKQGRLGEAADQYRQALRLDPKYPKALVGMATVAHRAAPPATTLQIARQAAEAAPKDPHALNELGVAQALAGQPAEAGKTFEQAREIEPDDWVLLLNSAANAARQKDWKQAEALCREAMAVVQRPTASGARRDEGTRALPRLLLAAMYLEQGNGEAGRAELERLAADQPRFAVAQAILGRARLAQGKLPEAVTAFEKAQALQPDWVMPVLDAGLALLAQNHREEARQQYERALKLSPKSVTAQLGLAVTLELTGRTAEAIAAYEKVLAAQPDSLMALNNLAFRYAEESVNLDRAVGLAKRATELAPQEGAIWDTLAWVCYRADRYDEARAHSDRAVQLSAANGQARYHLGKALLALKKNDEAAAAFRVALEKGLAPSEKQDAEQCLAGIPAGAR